MKNLHLNLPVLISFLLPLMCGKIEAQVDAHLMRYPDVSATQIVFTYAGDLWLVSKQGGTAVRLSAPDGEEVFPKFSPDGNTIAFNAQYDGAMNVYVIPAKGGIAQAVTSHSMADRLIDWYPDGEHLLFASSRESGKQRFKQLFKINKKGGMAKKLPLAYGEFASIAPDGENIAFTPKTRVFRTWKRYRGGMATDIYTFNLKTLASKNISDNIANDEMPMWHENTIYYMSDRGPEKRFNIWAYNLENQQSRQVTNFVEDDVHFPSLGPDEIVFSNGGEIYLLDLNTEKYHTVDIRVITDGITLQANTLKASGYIANVTVAPDGKRVIVEARGELFNLPAEKGVVKNITQSSGVAERHPAWSPDGKTVAYFTDENGAYELAVKDLHSGKAQVLSNYGPGYRYHLFWSPDSKNLAFMDNAMDVYVYNLPSGKTTHVDKGKTYLHGNASRFRVDWSPDSRWMTYSIDGDNLNQVLKIFDNQNKKLHTLTSGFYSDANPVFSPDGAYLYFTSDRNFEPVYSDFDNTFVYPNATRLAALTLRRDVVSPLAPENDEVATDIEYQSNTPEKEIKEDTISTKDTSITVRIDFDDIENRIVVLPVAPGNFGRIATANGKVLYHKRPNSGAGTDQSPILYYDLKERKEKQIIADADYFRSTAVGDKILVGKNGSMSIIAIAPDQSMKKMVPLNEMEMTVEPRAEWRQIFMDAWRFERDFFYDPDMHGVDWDAVREKYGSMISDAVTRWDVNFLIGEMIGELNASHTYRGGGDTDEADERNTGYLGIDFDFKNGKYTIGKIIRPASWETEVRSPLDQPGLDVQAGDYLLAVNGQPLDITKEPYHAFGGLGGKTVELTINRYENPDSAKTVIVQLLRDETRLRNLAWIEAHRQYVSDATGGRIGYIYVPSTGWDGQYELVRQFYGQWNKAGLIIDERWNNGGQIPDRFIELLNRKPLAYWAVRDGQNWQWPPRSNFGPKVMLINGWSGSGGDAFPDYFRKMKLGPLIGTRTWGGLIGISGSPSLIDGGRVSVPTFRMYEPGGGWFREGHGVEPDIRVPEDPTALAKGKDTQLDKAIEVVTEALKDQPKAPEQPPYEDRN